VGKIKNSENTTDDSAIQFTKNSVPKMAVNSESTTKYKNEALSEFATSYVTPKDKSTITDSVAFKMGSLEA